VRVPQIQYRLETTSMFCIPKQRKIDAKGTIVLWNVCILHDQPPIRLSTGGPSPGVASLTINQITHLLHPKHKMCGKFPLRPPYYFIASCLGTGISIAFHFILHLKSC
jgi:hypothetical protein